MLHDVMVWRDARLDPAELFYWRTSVGEEVDLVIETGGRLLPVEVQATARRTQYGNKVRVSLLLHTGTTLEWLAPDTQITL